MSKKEQQIYDLMTAIKRNTQPSAGIEVFENLLKELSDCRVCDVFVSDMNSFIGEFMVLMKEVDQIDNRTLKSKLVTYDFINPKRYFTKSFRTMLNVMRELKSYNVTYFENRTFNVGKTNMLGNLPAFDDNTIMAFPYEEVPEDKEAVYEHYRKIFLLWNYMPSIVKALIMTKRRSLGLDSNSKKFK